MNQKGFAPILIALGIILILGIVGGAYYLGTLKNKPQPQNPVITSQTPQHTSSPSQIDETANWKTYTNTKYNYSFIYPQNLEPLSPIDNSSDDIALADMSTVIPQSDSPYNGIGVTFNPLSSWGYSDSQTQSLDFEAYIKLVRETFPYGQGCDPKNGHEEAILINNEKGILFKDYCEGRDAIYIKIPNSQKVISITKAEKSKGSFDQTFKQILSTFKFTK